MREYPDPCEHCGKNIGNSCTRYRECADWVKRYRTRQAWINAAARKHNRSRWEVRKAFAYDHPDAVRRFLREGPCQSCGIQNICDVACEARLFWWEMRMRQLRDRIENERTEGNGKEENSDCSTVGYSVSATDANGAGAADCTPQG